MDDLGGLSVTVDRPAGVPRIAVQRLADVRDLGELARHSTADLAWLDSALPVGSPAAAARRAAWSVLAVPDGPFAARLRHEDRIAHVTVSGSAARWFGSSRVESRPAFAVLDELLRRTPTLDEPLPGCAFALGWVGFLGYELGREVDGPDRSADGHADADLRFVDRAVLVHADGSAWAIALVDDDAPTASEANRAWLAEVRASTTRDDVTVARPGLPVGDTVVVGRILEARGRVRRVAHEHAVDVCRHEIREGNAFQVCLTTAFSVPDAPPSRDGDRYLAEYRRVREGGPGPVRRLPALGRPADREPFAGAVPADRRRRERARRTDQGHPSPSPGPGGGRRDTRGALRQREGPRRERDDRRPAAERPAADGTPGLGARGAALRRRDLRQRAPAGVDGRRGAAGGRLPGRGGTCRVPTGVDDRRAEAQCDGDRGPPRSGAARGLLGGRSGTSRRAERSICRWRSGHW
ncbi:hypothetical protein DEJ36_15740 [Curtobacterium sp. MCPF17_052]|nr:hypothetical protein [Curtobacterium sp. MCPF17_052]WIB12182.1 hypothetical protein DEJ36_15740 [Curtobacterium sp. MCPF17_052]